MGVDLHKSIELVHDARDLSVPIVYIFKGCLPPNDLPIRKHRAQYLLLAVESAHSVNRPLPLLEHLHVQHGGQLPRVVEVVVERLIHPEAVAVSVCGVGISATTDTNIFLCGD